MGAFEEMHILPEPYRTQYQNAVRDVLAATFTPLFTAAFALFNVGVGVGEALKPVPGLFITGTMQVLTLGGLAVYLLAVYRRLPSPEAFR
jgi:hypothetical protein